MPTYQVKAVSGGETANDSVDIASISRPTSLVVPATTSTSADLSWSWTQNGGTAVDHFEVFYRKAGATSWTKVTANPGASARTATISDLTASTAYETRVEAVSADSTPLKASSGVVSFSTQTAADKVAPVTDLTATQHSSSSITIGWDWTRGGGLDNTGFTVRWRKDPGTGTWSSPVTKNRADRTHTITGLDSSTPYEIEVVTTAAGSETSTPTTITDTTTAPSAPGVPTNLRITESGSPDTPEHMVIYQWDAPTGTPAPTEYELEWSEKWDSLEETTNNERRNETSYVLANASSGSTYSGRVRSWAGTTPSAWTSVVSKTTATTKVEDPVSLSSPRQTATTVDLNWFQLSSGIVPDSYDVQWRTSPSGSWSAAQNTAFVPGRLTYAAVVSDLTAATAYDFRVTAKQGGTTGVSQVFTVSTS